MIRTFYNDIISNYFKEVRRLLYKADGRNFKFPEDPFDIKNGNTNNSISHDTDPNEKSKIELYPNRSHSEFLSQPFVDMHIDSEVEIEEFKNNFRKFPITTTQSSEDVKIISYFYMYSLYYSSYVEDLADKVIANYCMLRHEFLYREIEYKYRVMVNNYQNFINYAKVDFQFANNTKEEVIIQHLIIYYNDLLKIDNNQLSIFKNVLVSKQIANLYLKILIEFLTIRLNVLSPEIDKYYIVAPESKETEKRIGEKIVYELPENFSLIEKGIKSQALDIRGTAVLFYYLRKYQATIDYADTSFSKLVHYLSGYSADNLRKRSGFGNIIKIFKETRGGVEKSNLKNVKSLLEKIISDIDKEIKK